MLVLGGCVGVVDGDQVAGLLEAAAPDLGEAEDLSVPGPDEIEVVQQCGHGFRVALPVLVGSGQERPFLGVRAGQPTVVVAGASEGEALVLELAAGLRLGAGELGLFEELAAHQFFVFAVHD
ncbi:hypothetical protein KP696_28030 [Nocardia seriolae]|uniref:Uncharacterized protein n=1 Tax=Nocardia seriolae TaxID=37332 RepID=A0ABC9Z4M9_9NOCA|nr:hypothetical protein NS14008_22660 [Nocardia seriolae]PSK27609.1 hypothetical protein C6575_30985 [Nocardia seriolae]RLP26466.1 hypothetical protein D6158_30905 [Nocardia seriolae]GAM50586.1 hypothetical protein NS07_v2contig00161-0011 [Nocardia seriolae]GAP32542.1 hypothetical protein NSK11_contig00164-0013 [Nocardia seriolae]